MEAQVVHCSRRDVSPGDDLGCGDGTGRRVQPRVDDVVRVTRRPRRMRPRLLTAAGRARPSPRGEPHGGEATRAGHLANATTIAITRRTRGTNTIDTSASAGACSSGAPIAPWSSVWARVAEPPASPPGRRRPGCRPRARVAWDAARTGSTDDPLRAAALAPCTTSGSAPSTSILISRTGRASAASSSATTGTCRVWLPASGAVPSRSRYAPPRVQGFHRKGQRRRSRHGADGGAAKDDAIAEPVLRDRSLEQVGVRVERFERVDSSGGPDHAPPCAS